MRHLLARYGTVIAVTLLGVTASLGLWQYGRSQERARIEVEFEAATENYAEALQRSIDFAELLVRALRAWQTVAPATGRGHLQTLTTPLIRDLRGVGALEWVPRVRGEDREAYEAAMRRAGIEGFTIRQRGARGSMVPASRRADYFPVSDVDPVRGPSPVVGFDLASEPARRDAIRRAIATGRTAATTRLDLVQTHDQFGLQLFSPVFEGGTTPPADQREERLAGFVVAVLRVGDLVEGALAYLQPFDVELEVLDTTAPPAERRVYARLARGRPASDAPPADPPALVHESGLRVGDRTWSVRTRLGRAAFESRETRNPTSLLIAGLLTTALLGAGLLVNARKASAIQAASQDLRAALEERDRADEALRHSELLLRTVIDEQTELIARWGTDGTVRFVSPSLSRFLARSRGQLEGRPLTDVLGEVTATALTTRLSGLTPEHPVSNVELPVDDAAGRTFWYAWTRRAVFDGEGSVTHYQAVGRDITVRKRAQESLREQEERFRRLADATFEGIALTFDGRFVDANSQMARLLGYEVAHLLGREVTQFVAPESLAEVERRIRGGDEGPYEHMALRRDGSRIPVEVRARSIVLSGKRVRISAVRDVTEQKRAREELDRSRAFLDTIFTGLDLAVWVLDVDPAGELRPAACNPAFLALVGLDPEQIAGCSFDELARVMPQEQVAAERAAIRRCVEAGVPVREAVADGLLSSGERDFLRQLNPLRDAAGRVFRVIGTIIEVTELRRAERTLLEGQRLRAQAERIARLGGWEADLTTGTLRVSEQVWRIAGEPPNVPPLEAWTWDTLGSVVDEADAPRILEAVARLRQGHELADLELRFPRPDGGLTIALVHGETERDESGRPLRVTGTMQDVTERRRAEEAAERQRQELLQADKMIALGTLLSGVAHEINNPNHFILLNLPLLRSAWRDATPVLDAHAEREADFTLAGLPYPEMRGEVPELIEEVIQGAERIKLIVSELRGYTREQTHSVAPISVDDAVTSALTLLANPIRKATRRFSASLHGDLPPVKGNLRRLEQVVINLLLNACQSLSGPDRAVSVETGYDAEEGRVFVKVVDEGTGIPEAVLGRITDPFFTTKREAGGTGLGLSVSARIVEDHGGRLSFESRVGSGTTARLSLPVAREDA